MQFSLAMRIKARNYLNFLNWEIEKMLMAKSENGWELHTISNGKLSCEKFNLDATTTEIERVKSSIQQKFGKIIDEEGILVSWDNWSGMFIMQMPGMNTASSDALIKEIYEFLVETNLD